MRVDELLRRKRTDDAAKLLEELQERFPASEEVLTGLLMVYGEVENGLGLERAGRKLLQLDPDSPDALSALTIAYGMNFRPALAVSTARRFLKHHPRHESASGIRDVLVWMEQMLPEILKDQGLFGDDALETAALHEEVQILLEQGQLAEAVRTGENLLRRRPDLVPVHNNLVMAYALEGRFDRAVEHARKVLDLKPGNAHGLSNMVRALTMWGRLDEAGGYRDRLAALAPQDPAAWTKKVEGLTYLRDDQAALDAAREAHRRRVIQDGRQGGYVCHLAGVAAFRLGDEQDAQSWWRRALKLDPGCSIARKNLDDLHKPESEQNAPWPFPMEAWVSSTAFRDLLALVKTAGPDAEIGPEVRRYLRQHPELAALAPVLLERGDPIARQLVVHLGGAARTPELLEALKEFGLSRNGPDAVRRLALQVVSEEGTVPPGPARVWVEGEWRELVLLGWEIYTEPEGSLPPDLQPLFEEAYDASQAGDWVKAERLLRQLRERDPDNPHILNNLAGACRVLGRAAEAERLVRRAHEIDPDYLFGIVGVAHLALNEGRLKEAQELLDPLLRRRRLHRSEFAALSELQLALLEARGKIDGARSWLDMWEGIDPDHPLIAVWRRRLNPKKPPASLPKIPKLPGIPPPSIQSGRKRPDWMR